MRVSPTERPCRVWPLMLAIAPILIDAITKLNTAVQTKL
jgi:hypothetical protein